MMEVHDREKGDAHTWTRSYLDSTSSSIWTPCNTHVISANRNNDVQRNMLDGSRLVQIVEELCLIIEKTGVRAAIVDRALQVRQCTPAVFDLVPGIHSVEGLLPKLAEALEEDYDLVRHIGDTFENGCTIDRETRTRDGRPIVVRTIPCEYFIPGNCVIVSFVSVHSSSPSAQARTAATISMFADAVIGLTPEGNVTEWNAAAQQLYGYTEGEAVGRHLSLIAPTGAEPDLGVLLRHAAEGHEIESFETRQRTKAGKHVYVSLRMIPTRLADGRVVGTMIAARDITKRRLAEIAMRYEQEMAQQYLGIAGVMIVVIGFDQRVKLINQRGCELLGYPESEILGRNWFATFLPDYAREQALQKFEGILARRDPVHEYLESVVVTRSGEERLIAWHHAVVRDQERYPIGTLSSGEDITERRKMEDALKRSEEQFRRAIINAPVPVILHAESGEILEISRACTQITGYTQADLPTIAEWRKRAYRQHQDPGNLPYSHDKPRLEGDYVVMTRNAERRIWEFYSAPLGMDAHGRQLVITTATDITECRSLERQILEISAHERRRISRDLHDILASHLSGIAMLSRALIADATAGRPVEIAELDIIAQLAREGAEQARTLAHGVSPWELPPEGLTSALASLASNTERLSGITCSFTGPASLPPLRGEVASQLYLIAREAVNNAVKHSEAGRISIRLEVTATSIMLDVDDDGRGLAAKATEGDGMGIRLMRYRANVIGGDLSIGTLTDGGTCVTCTLWMDDAIEHPEST
ncbi:MAG TPA: PAS domain S-box protein [Candidatus Kapabacteria bacterium]|nr:PAS domain S-box protein [Candidatus Kapabacteria bacterium]